MSPAPDFAEAIVGLPERVANELMPCAASLRVGLKCAEICDNRGIIGSASLMNSLVVGHRAGQSSEAQ